MRKPAALTRLFGRFRNHESTQNKRKDAESPANEPEIRVYLLKDPEARRLLYLGMTLGKRMGWAIGRPEGTMFSFFLDRTIVIETRAGTELVQFVYTLAPNTARETVINHFKISPKTTNSWLLFAVYAGVAYPIGSRTTRILFEACATGLPPSICALNAQEVLT